MASFNFMKNNSPFIDNIISEIKNNNMNIHSIPQNIEISSGNLNNLAESIKNTVNEQSTNITEKTNNIIQSGGNPIIQFIKSIFKTIWNNKGKILLLIILCIFLLLGFVIYKFKSVTSNYIENTEENETISDE